MAGTTEWAGSAGPPPGIHLRPAGERPEEVEALADLCGGRAGVGAVLDDLDRRLHRAPLGRLAGRAVDRAWGFEAADRRTRRWWPQGVTTATDAVPGAVPGDRSVVALSWYSREVDGVRHGCRVTLCDTAARRYRHVLVVVPHLDGGRLHLEPLQVHAGGLAWVGPWLHVAATGRGFASCRLDDLVRVPDHQRAVAPYGYRYLLPVRAWHRSGADEGVERLRHSFLSVDRSGSPPALVVGEYGRGRQTTRLVGFALDLATGEPVLGGDGQARPVWSGTGVPGMQGVAVVDGRHHVTTSHGPWTPGSVRTGHPGALHRHRWATPMGPEDLDHDPATGLLWTVTEHPRRRWLVAMAAARFAAADT